MASPFQAVTTLSSRAGCGRASRAASSSSRTVVQRAWSSGSARSCSVDEPCSNVPASVTDSSRAAHSPSSYPSTAISCAGVHA